MKQIMYIVYVIICKYKTIPYYLLPYYLLRLNTFKGICESRIIMSNFDIAEKKQ